MNVQNVQLFVGMFVDMTDCIHGKRRLIAICLQFQQKYLCVLHGLDEKIRDHEEHKARKP